MTTEDVYSVEEDGTFTGYSLVSVKSSTGDLTAGTDPVTGDPVPLIEGMVVANSVDQTLKVFVNSAWSQLATW